MFRQKQDPQPPAPNGSGLVETEVPIGEIASPHLLKAHAVWDGRRGSRRFPARDDIAPRDMASFLRNTALIKVVDGGRDYQFRITGDAIVQVQGHSCQGMTLTEVERAIPGYGKMLKPTYDLVLARAAPVAFRGFIARSPGGRAFGYETVLLPLGPDAIDHILVVAVHDYSDAKPST